MATYLINKINKENLKKKELVIKGIKEKTRHTVYSPWYV
jgi:hypothetical protein